MKECDIDLFEAIERDDAQRAATCLNSGASVNARDSVGTTLLMRAAERGCLDCVELLLSRGADIDLADTEGDTALSYAVARPSNVQVIGALLLKGANPNARRADGTTILMDNVRDELLDNTKLLIERGIDLNALNDDGDTALTNAACWGQFETVKALVGAGVDIGLPDGAGCTPLQLAMQQSHERIAHFLRSAGAR